MKASRTRFAWLIVAALAGCGAAAQAAGTGAELTASAIHFIPGEDEDYDRGWGGEVQARFWLNESVGLALAGGGATWELNRQGNSVVYNGRGASATLDGDVELYPLGGSILFRALEKGTLALTLEAGVRYVVVQSDAKVDARVIAPGEDLVLVHDTVGVEDGVVGLVGANIEGALGDHSFLFFGAGYQFDLVEGEATWEDQDLGDNELEAVFIRVGLGLKL